MIRIKPIGMIASLIVVPFLAVLLSVSLTHSPSISANSPDKTAVDAQALDNIDEELIYIDDEGTIRVLDTTPGSHGELTWTSPDKGFIDVAAGDFNLDGDQELVGVKNVNGKGRIVIYDPVISEDGVEPDGWFGNVPWRTLDTVNVDDPINILGVGNLNLDLAGDEILIVTELDNGGTGVRVYSSSDQNIDGTGWQVHIPADFTWHWDAVAIGNIDGEKTDEVVLLSSLNISDSNTSRLHIYQVDTTSLASKSPVVTRDLNTISWTSAAIGEVKNLGPLELVAVGDADGNINNNIHVFKPNLSAGTMDYVDANDRDSVNPNPDLTFLADVTGIVNNQRDTELFFLRSAPASSTDVPRFFARNQGNDAFDADLFDLTLDTDNGWKAGTGADVDGDAKDEIVLMRDDAIRIFSDPDVGVESTDTEDIATDSTNIIGANLDSNGVREPLRFEATISGIENGLEEGKTGSFIIRVDSDEPIAFTASLPNEPAWVNALTPLSGQSPEDLTLSVNTAGLNPGKYTTTVRVSPSNPAALGGDVDVEVTLNVLDNSFNVEAGIRGLYAPCKPPFFTAPSELVSITSSAPATFTAIILPKDASAAALLSLNGPAVAAKIDGAQIILSDAAGNSAMVALPNSAAVAASNFNRNGTEGANEVQEDFRWPSAVPWIFAQSNSNTTPSSIELVFLPEKLLEEDIKFGQATLLVIADEDVVAAPFNVRYSDVDFLCADNVVMLPVVQQSTAVR